MTDASTVVPLVSGLGGAVIGAAAAIYRCVSDGISLGMMSGPFVSA
jgi:hypothetical protein